MDFSLDLSMSADAFSLEHSVTIYRNGDLSNPKTLTVPPHWTHDEFLNAATKRLNLVPGAKRLFDENGAEIEDIAYGLGNGDIVFVSRGESFRQPRKAKGEPQEATIGGYTIGKPLGEGGFGTVRLGTHQVTGEVVALKFLKKQRMESTSAASRVVTEVQCLAQLQHPNVIRLVEVLDEPSHCILVLQYAEGGDLRGYVEGLKAGRMSEKEAHSMFRQITSAVSYAHKNHICHRDLKLENILLTGDHKTVKITDFGLSTFFKPGEVNKSSAGSLYYLPPEVLRGESNAGPPIDVWSMGVILYALLYGRLPFEATGKDDQDLEHRIKQRIMKADYRFPDDVIVSPEAKDLIRQMLTMDPEHRLLIPQIFSHPWLLGTTSSSLSFSRRNRLGGSPRAGRRSKHRPRSAAVPARRGKATPAPSQAHPSSGGAGGGAGAADLLFSRRQEADTGRKAGSNREVTPAEMQQEMAAARRVKQLERARERESASSRLYAPTKSSQARRRTFSATQARSLPVRSRSRAASGSDEEPRSGPAAAAALTLKRISDPAARAAAPAAVTGEVKTPEPKANVFDHGAVKHSPSATRRLRRKSMLMDDESETVVQHDALPPQTPSLPRHRHHETHEGTPGHLRGRRGSRQGGVLALDDEPGALLVPTPPRAPLSSAKTAASAASPSSASASSAKKGEEDGAVDAAARAREEEKARRLARVAAIAARQKQEEERQNQSTPTTLPFSAQRIRSGSGSGSGTEM